MKDQTYLQDYFDEMKWSRTSWEQSKQNEEQMRAPEGVLNEADLFHALQGRSLEFL